MTFTNAITAATIIGTIIPLVRNARYAIGVIVKYNNVPPLIILNKKNNAVPILNCSAPING